MPTFTCGSTTLTNAWRREAPSVIADNLDVPGDGIEEPLHDEDRERELQRADDEDDAGDGIQHPDPVHEEEDRDDEGHRGKAWSTSSACRKLARPAKAKREM